MPEYFSEYPNVTTMERGPSVGNIRKYHECIKCFYELKTIRVNDRHQCIPVINTNSK